MEDINEGIEKRNTEAAMDFFFISGMVKAAMYAVDCADRRNRGRIAVEELEGIDEEVSRMLKSLEGQDKELKLPPFAGGAEK